MADVSSIASMASSMSQAQLQADVQTSVTRKALDIQESNAQQLIDALPDAGGPSGAPVNPAERVGSLVDTSA
ncbi:putative motility protein [Aquisalimonas sp. 2447]|uniref:YjfB family protein n=1 Tax=Aquisalimonas sp. 2447 TaxID=2740807 RepID=UPI00143275AF|nr:YjfB family protein [Aquisalimonas sp. 2447]QIT54661.1 putative motility protein [Aquisalimonas sp. 2447]